MVVGCLAYEDLIGFKVDWVCLKLEYTPNLYTPNLWPPLITFNPLVYHHVSDKSNTV